MVLCYFQLPSFLMLREVTLNEVRQQRLLRGQVILLFSAPKHPIARGGDLAIKGHFVDKLFYFITCTSVHCNGYQVVLEYCWKSLQNLLFSAPKHPHTGVGELE